MSVFTYSSDSATSVPPQYSRIWSVNEPYAPVVIVTVTLDKAPKPDGFIVQIFLGEFEDDTLMLVPSEFRMFSVTPE